MGPEVLLAILGPIAGGTIGVGTFLVRRAVTNTDMKLQAISENVEVISHQVTALQLKLAESYVTKEELIRHIASEERWQNQVLTQIHELRNEVMSVRNNTDG